MASSIRVTVTGDVAPLSLSLGAASKQLAKFGGDATAAGNAVVASTVKQREALAQMAAAYSGIAASAAKGSEEQIVAADMAAAAQKKLAGSMAATRTEVAATSGSFMSMGKAMNALLGFAVVGIGIKSAVSAAASFGKAMELIHTQAGGTQAEVVKMTAALQAMAPAVGAGPKALAEGLFYVESAGFRGAKALQLVKVAAEGAAVGGSNLADTANLLAGVMRSGVIGTEDLGKAMGTLNAIIGGGKMKMQDLIGALRGGLLDVAKNLGVSLIDVGAAMDVMTSKTTNADQASTFLRQTMLGLLANTHATQKAFESIGLTSTQLAETMRSKGLVAAIVELKQHLDASGLSAVQVSQLMASAFGKRAVQGVLSLIGNVDLLVAKQKQVAAGANSFGAAWEATQQTAAFSMERFKASLQLVEITIGTALLPSVAKVAKAFSDWIQNAQKTGALQRDMATLKDVIGGVATAVGGAVKALKVLADAVGGPKKAVELLIAAFVILKGVSLSGALITSLQNIGLAARTSTGEVTLLQRGLMTLNGFAAIATITIIYHREIKSTVDKFGNWLSNNLPGGNWNPDDLLRHIPGVAQLQDSSFVQKVMTFLTFGTKLDTTGAQNALKAFKDSLPKDMSISVKTKIESAAKAAYAAGKAAGDAFVAAYNAASKGTGTIFGPGGYPMSAPAKGAPPGGFPPVMAHYTGVPAPLANAIDAAAKKYGVPASVLAGIWKIESGSTYPNPAVNSSGYGGLFGTANWNAPTQTQANTSASILAKLIKKDGSLSAALLQYSGGGPPGHPTGKGYSSVPGMGPIVPTQTGYKEPGLSTMAQAQTALREATAAGNKQLEIAATQRIVELDKAAAAALKKQGPIKNADYQKALDQLIADQNSLTGLTTGKSGKMPAAYKIPQKLEASIRKAQDDFKNGVTSQHLDALVDLLTQEEKLLKAKGHLAMAASVANEITDARKKFVDGLSKVVATDMKAAAAAGVKALAAFGAGKDSAAVAMLQTQEKDLKAAQTALKQLIAAEGGKATAAQKAELKTIAARLAQVAKDIDIPKMLADMFAASAAQLKVLAAQFKTLTAQRQAAGFLSAADYFKATADDITGFDKALAANLQAQLSNMQSQLKVAQAAFDAAKPNSNLKAALGAKVKGLTASLKTLAGQVTSAMGTVEQDLAQAVSTAQSQFSSALSTLQTDLASQIQTNAEAASGYTGTSAQLTSMQVDDTVGGLNDALAAAQKQLETDTAAGASVTADQIAQDQKALTAAQRALTEYNLGVTAQTQLTAANKDAADKTKAFNTGLSDLEGKLLSGKITAEQFKQGLADLITSVGGNVSASDSLAAEFALVVSAAGGVEGAFNSLIAWVNKMTGQNIPPVGGAAAGSGGGGGGSTPAPGSPQGTSAQGSGPYVGTLPAPTPTPSAPPVANPPGTNPACFVGETLVRVPGGAKRIDEILVGDLVLVYDFSLGRVVETTVTDVQVHTGDDQRTVLELATTDRAVLTTAEHPFWTGTEWVAAGRLRPGGPVFVADGDTLIPTAVGGLRTLAGTRPVYNLHVAHPDHNYVANGFLVHNMKIGLATGGIIRAMGGLMLGGSPSGIDNIPILASAGEMVINGAQQARLWNMVQGGSPQGGRGGGNTYNITFPAYVGDKRELVNMLRTELSRIQARN